MRPRLRPMLNAFLLNLLLAAGLIGYPIVRGRVRSENMARAYAAYAACLHAGTTRDAPGLAFPEHHRERFAALYLHAVPEWPASCRDALDRIPQDEAFLLMPGAKTGEEEVRSAAIGARAALDAVIEARAAERRPQIPVRLLRTLDHLAAAVSVSIGETGLSYEVEHLAFDLGEGPSLVEPSRVPLQTAAGGPMFVTVHGETLRIATADARSASVIAVHDGTVDVTQVRRPAAARALIDDGTHTYLGWVTGESTCAHDEAHCARRLTGLALLRAEVTSPEPEVWIAAHPALSLARSFAFDRDALVVFARTVDGAELRSFTLPAPWPDAAPPAAADAPIRPITGSDTVLPGEVVDAALASSTPVTTSAGIVLACAGHAFTVHRDVVDVSEAVPMIGLAQLEGGGSTPQMITTITPRGTHPIDVLAPARGVDSLEDHVRCTASDAGAALAWIDREGTLRVVDDLESWRTREVATHVAGFAISRDGETSTVASWGEDGERAVTLHRVWRGRVLASDVAAACWDDGAGLCGPAGLASDGDHVMLFAREGTDLRVVRVTGAGLAPLTGLGDD